MNNYDLDFIKLVNEKKYNVKSMSSIADLVVQLVSKVNDLENKYKDALIDIKRLEEDNIEITNELYRLENSLDSRIDILAQEFLNSK